MVLVGRPSTTAARGPYAGAGGVYMAGGVTVNLNVSKVMWDRSVVLGRRTRMVE